MTELPGLEEVVGANEETADRVRNNVYGTIILSKEKTVLQTSFDNTTTQGVANLLAGSLVNSARSAVRDIDPTDDLQFLRVYSRKTEWMVGPDAEFTIVVQQT